LFCFGWGALLAAGLLLGLGRPAGTPATPVLASGSLLGQTLTLELLDALALTFSLGFSAALFAWPVVTPSGRERLLGLADLTRDVPWGGLAAATGVLLLLLLLARSGAATWLQATLSGLLPDAHSPFLFLLVLVIVTTFATEVMNNTTVSTVLFPIAAAGAPAMGADPLVAMLGVSLASTCAFMTPVATPVNALALASLRGLSLRRILLSGLVTNVMTGLWIALCLTYAVPPVLRLFGGP
jgi:sodium-dependent dicarboxylate transporter 2/3/5